ncbi:MAG: peptidylprolyl isomerase [Proteobacteria bacterium]|nr:peptidylprolyl isomerase [Pseudomonadota bacterium]MBU4297179.1 peptidylprolyl isomerase [Pseudomonadota bacterium]MCG2748782.1 peptidylprolyl isomerase [Desulfobulbaceae bacterium]
MKRIKYLASAIFLGAVLLASPVVASTPAPAASGASITSEQAVATPDKNGIDANRQKAAEARKEIVARVNGAEINTYDLLGMMNRVANAFYRDVKEPTEEITREIRLRALDRLIFEELAVEAAEKQGIKPKAEKTQEVIDNLKSSYDTEEGFAGYLADIALTEEQLRARIDRGQLLEGITGREVYQKTSEDPAAMDRIYKEFKEAGKLRKSENYQIKEILVMAGKDEPTTSATAAEILAQLRRNNNDFGKLMLDGTFIVRTVQVNKDRNPAIFAKMLGMKVGEFSGVVQDGNTFHIFQVLAKEPARDMTEDEARTMLEDRLASYFQEKRRAEWIKELRKDAKVEILLDK